MAPDWVEERPGFFTKELGGLEKIYRMTSQIFKDLDREQWGLYCLCTFQLHPSSTEKPHRLATAWRDAWVALRRDYPGLAVVPDGVTRKTYQQPTDESVGKWADETFLVHDTADLDTILASYPARDLPSLYYLPSSSSILLLVSHWRIDGIGTCMLLDHLFTLFAQKAKVSSWAPDHVRLSPCLEDAAGAPTTSTPELEALAQKSIQEHHRTAVNSGGLPYLGDEKRPPSSPACAAIVLTGASTAGMAGACRARGISITAAVQAALAGSVLAMSPEKPDRYAAVVSVNMRRYLGPPYDGPGHALQVYVTGVAPAVGRQDTFLEKAGSLTAFYKGWHTEGFAQKLRLETKLHADALSRGPPPGAKPPSSATLSSLGIIEKYLGGKYGGKSGTEDVKVTGFRFGVSMMTRQVLLYVWTFDGRLSLSVNYNDAYHDREGMGSFLDFLLGILSRELGVHLEVQ